MSVRRLLIACFLLIAFTAAGCVDDETPPVQTPPEAEAVDPEAPGAGADPARTAQANLQAGQAFLRENARREGVVETPSGLQYEIVEEGTGDRPAPTDRVTIDYEGTLLDGTVFDSSYDRGEPTTYPLNQFIPGWIEGLQQVREGGTIRLVIPPDLAYGERGIPGGPIGPNETLVFEVELHEIAR